MTNKIKVLMLHIVYPLSMSKYFKRALKRRDDIDLIDCGPFTGQWIPWMGGMTLPSKYSEPPTVPLPFGASVGRVSYDLVRANLPAEWKPDVVLTVDAGICWSAKPHEGIVAHVATDPHALNYDYQRKISDKFFNMQKSYSQDGDIYLPYAYDPTVHYPVENAIKDTDAVLIGMPYEQRIIWVNELRKRGVSVIFENGPIFDEYRELNNRARIGLNWSSMDDLNARAFELAAMKLAPVMNFVTDADKFFKVGIDYKGFPAQTSLGLQQAVNTVIYLKENDDVRIDIANNAYNAVKPHTYDARVSQILKEGGF